MDKPMDKPKFDNSGALFRNERKDSPNHPDYTDNLTVDGVEHYLSAWLKDGKRGKFMSVAIKPKDGVTHPRMVVDRPMPMGFKQAAKQPDPLLDDDIPF